jgi:hypothetical protein
MSARAGALGCVAQALARPPAPRPAGFGQASLVIAMTIPMRVKITIRIWTTIQKRGISNAAPLLDDGLT